MKVKLIDAGIRQLLLSSEIEEVCKNSAMEIKNKCGDGYEVNTYRGKNRVNASVKTSSNQANRDNFKNNTLLKAVR